VDAYTSHTLRLIADQGVALVIATGRHYRDVAGIRSTLGVRAHLITSNGARVHDPDDRLIHQRNIDPELVRQLAAPEFAHDTLLNFYLDDTWLIDQPCDWIQEMHQDSGFQYQVSDLARHPGNGVAKILYVSEHDHLVKLEARIQVHFGSKVTITFSAENCLEVMAPAVSKGNALKLVLNQLGISAENCLAFGDGQNDLELLQTAGHPRLMGNAHPRMSAQLPQVLRIGSNQDAGVARHLRTLFVLPD
jgi:Cof subfamily protein (haloacid dehalogenase superfamily)